MPIQHHMILVKSIGSFWFNLMTIDHEQNLPKMDKKIKEITKKNEVIEMQLTEVIEMHRAEKRQLTEKIEKLEAMMTKRQNNKYMFLVHEFFK